MRTDLIGLVRPMSEAGGEVHLDILLAWSMQSLGLESAQALKCSKENVIWDDDPCIRLLNSTATYDVWAMSEKIR